MDIDFPADVLLTPVAKPKCHAGGCKADPLSYRIATRPDSHPKTVFTDDVSFIGITRGLRTGLTFKRLNADLVFGSVKREDTVVCGAEHLES